jgi:glutathione peroxidase
MTIRQWILKKIYPVFLSMQKKRKGKHILENTNRIPPAESFHQLSLQLNNGQQLDLGKLSGKKVLLVNTASDCGYTGQYAELQKLYQHMREELEIIGFPSNDFKEQEKGSDEEIAKFCAENYGVGFPLAKKNIVSKKEGQQPVFTWLSNRGKNGWNDKAPEWNFSKYLVNEAGILTHYFPPGVSPLDSEFISALQE